MIAEILAYSGLAFGILFFTYAIRHYAALINIAISLFRNNSLKNSSVRNYNGSTTNGIRLRIADNKLTNGGRVDRSPPMISIHVPLYNEEKVVDRLMEALTSIDYPNYEVIVVDDSTDSTFERLKNWNRHPKVKIIHRDNRRGFKGGALNEALKNMNNEARYVVVFDADFIPPKDILWRFLEVFENNENGYGIESWEKRDVVAVQGYQWHILNASENWITRAVTAEYAGNYLVERVYMENLPGLKMVAGSVFMIRADIIKRYGWRESLTEDWDLTLRFYRDGYKVLYTPLIAAPAECPSTLIALMRQRSRWAEGHTFAVKKYFREILQSRFLSLREKLEFLYLTPYYLNSFFFIIGTFSWLLAEFLGAKISFWTSLFGWSLLFTNLMAIPFINLTGLFLEYRASRHWTGAFMFIPLMHLLAIPQAIAAFKGLIEKRESAWFRTLKTGKITELNLFYHLRRILRRERSKRRVSRKMWAMIIFIPFLLSVLRLIQIGSYQSMIGDNLVLTLLPVTLATSSILLIIGRRSDKLYPTMIKTAALVSTTTLIISIAITTPTEALPKETLYLRSDFYSNTNIRILGYSSDGSQVTIEPNKSHWWRSVSAYNFVSGDRGVWDIYMFGRTDNSFTLYIYFYAYDPKTNQRFSLGPPFVRQIGCCNFGFWQPYNKDININCQGCNLDVEIIATQSFILYTGNMGFQSRIEIPENTVVLLIALFAFLIVYHRGRLGKWRRERRTSRPT